MENGLKELQQRLVEMLSSFQKFTQQMGRRRGYCNDAGRFRKNGIPDESAA